MAVYCEEFERAKGAKAAPAPHHCKALRELVLEALVGPERVRGAAQVFFADEDPWLKKVSYNLGAFVDRFQQCDLRAQNRERLAPLRAEPGPGAADHITADEAASVADLFSAAKRGVPCG